MNRRGDTEIEALREAQKFRIRRLGVAKRNPTSLIAALSTQPTILFD